MSDAITIVLIFAEQVINVLLLDLKIHRNSTPTDPEKTKLLMESPKKGNSKDKSHTVVDFYFVGPQKSVERFRRKKNR